jgi:hypothetical protein
MRLHNPAYPEKFLLQVAIVGISIWRFVGPASLVTGESESAFPLPPSKRSIDRFWDFGILQGSSGRMVIGPSLVVSTGTGFFMLCYLGLTNS